MRALITVVGVFAVIVTIVGLVMLMSVFVERFTRPRPPHRRGILDLLRSLISGWTAARDRRKRAQAPWTYYSRMDPITGDYVIGIRRVLHDLVIDNVEMHRVPADDYETRVEWESQAILRADACNITTRRP